MVNLAPAWVRKEGPAYDLPIAPEVPLIRSRHFRAPRHTISHAGLVDGGNWPHPGEMTSRCETDHIP
jgi:predicted ATPase with chaperone activity